MIKIFYILFLFFLAFSKVFGENDINIITRQEWGANEEYRFVDSTYWQDIFKKRHKQALENKYRVYTDEELKKQEQRRKKIKEMNSILLNNYGNEIALSSVNKYENNKKLAWPISKMKHVNGIVIHHTDSNYKNDIIGINAIYKYHALTRAWGDIGYNFLIGSGGLIYEGRAGGDYVVGAHDKWNNRGNIGIAIMGDYSKNPINEKQYEGLKKLVKYLIDKYNIDITEKVDFHQECFGDDCKLPLFTKKMYPIVGHRDAGHTSCPGDKLYKQIDDLRIELLKEPKFAKILAEKRLFKKLDNFSEEKLLDILAKINFSLDDEFSKKYENIKNILTDYFNYKEKKKKNNLFINHDNKQKIKIKLSYPNNDFISIKSGRNIFNITRKGNKLLVKGHEFNSLKIPKKNKNTILEIISWDRKPSWDKNGIYNDNKFRGDIILYVKNNKLIVVNDLKIEDYLKGLGEVSNSENPEKIKTIIVAARTYATWYTTKARKFPGELYDGVDNPDIFQKYLGYSLELRSPNINKIVDETRGQIIKYKGNIIKPWYFSSSNGKTLSYYDYCLKKYNDSICSIQAKKYPYLQSVIDKGSKGTENIGHGVGISGSGVSYFVNKGWNYEMIIKYFLKGVDIL